VRLGRRAEPDTSDAWLLVGLGNPGPEYVRTRHNLGFLVVEALADRIDGRWKSHRGRADVVEGRFDGARVVLAKPRSYMNESGGPVASVRSYFRVPLDRLVVVHDELDLEFGRIKVKIGGGDAGHNGLRSLRGSLGSGDFVRVRCGIGRPPGRGKGADWVLSDFRAAERSDVDLMVESAADAVTAVVTDGLDAAQRMLGESGGADGARG
jgi:peptidyl-tRNA hydrolase, PTH1 family